MLVERVTQRIYCECVEVHSTMGWHIEGMLRLHCTAAMVSWSELPDQHTHAFCSGQASGWNLMALLRRAWRWSRLLKTYGSISTNVSQAASKLGCKMLTAEPDNQITCHSAALGHSMNQASCSAAWTLSDAGSIMEPQFVQCRFHADSKGQQPKHTVVESEERRAGQVVVTCQQQQCWLATVVHYGWFTGPGWLPAAAPHSSTVPGMAASAVTWMFPP